MATLSVAAAWDETVAFVRREGRLLFPVSFMLIALPAALAEALSPAGAAGEPPAPGPWLLIFPVALLLSAIGNLAISALALRPGASVAEALRSMDGHRTADEVHAYLGQHGAALPRTSVYNALTTLADLGVVLRADVGPGAAVYEFAQAWHHHFVCRRCGQVSDVSCVVGTKPCLTAGDEVGDVDEAQVIFRGVCRTCLAAGSAAGTETPTTVTRAGEPSHEHPHA